LSSLFGEDSSHVFEQNEEMHGIYRGGDEIEVLIKVLGFLVFGVDREGTDAGDVGRLQGALHRISQECLGDAVTLPAPINCQACQQHDWNRVSRQALFQPLGRFFGPDFAHHKGVEADNRIADEANVRLGSTSLLRRDSASLRATEFVVIAVTDRFLIPTEFAIGRDCES
jgi:hypothetical protein